MGVSLIDLKTNDSINVLAGRVLKWDAFGVFDYDETTLDWAEFDSLLLEAGLTRNSEQLLGWFHQEQIRTIIERGDRFHEENGHPKNNEMLGIFKNATHGVIILD